MNRGEFLELQKRVARRRAELDQEQESPLLLGLAMIAFAGLAIIVNFI